ncbi:MAG: hypothetical protein STSR0004_10770 [Peptococcaceae bacterium]
MLFLKKSRFKLKLLLVTAVLLTVLILTGSLTTTLAQQKTSSVKSTAQDTTQDTEETEEETVAPPSRPLTVIIDGQETTSDQPILVKGTRIYVPLRFVTEALGYPIQWDNSTKTAYIGARYVGTDLVDKKTARTGVKIKQPVKVGGVGYPKGYILGPSAFHEISWDLGGRFNHFTFNFGVPDNNQMDTAGFTVMADGRKKLGEKVISKDDGLKEVSFGVKGVNTVTVKNYKQAGGVVVSPRAQ